MQFIIDRFEGDYAVLELEDGSFLRVPASLLQKCGAVEGDVLDMRVNKKETARRKAGAKKLLGDFFND